VLPRTDTSYIHPFANNCVLQLRSRMPDDTNTTKM
jgi:hypothetical protein